MICSHKLCLLLVLAALGCGGCTTTVIPPRAPANPVAVYLTDYGKHSSVLMPDSDGRLTEYAFGDWNWFALEHKSSGGAVSALCCSGASALGRRQIDPPDKNSLADVARIVSDAKVTRFEVSHGRVNALLAELDSIYQQHKETATYAKGSQMWFVKYSGGYSGCHNCNHATAHWLRELGCEIRGSAMLSKFVVKLENQPGYGPATAP